MCGLLGWTVEPEHVGTIEHAIMIAMLARSMDSRGGHSHGLWTGRDLIKGLGDLATSDKISLSELARLPYTLGHTRFATVGARTIDNSHPWIFEHNARRLIGAHNGQVSNHWELNSLHARRLPVDSMHLFQHLIEDKPLSEVNAYGAITYTEDGITSLGRFNNGELSVLTTPRGIYWASTDTALKYAAWAAGLIVVKLQQLKQNRLYTLAPYSATPIVKAGPLKVGAYHEGWNFYRAEDVATSSVTPKQLSPVDRASASLDDDDLVYEENTADTYETGEGTKINDPFHWSADAQAAYNEYVASERGAEDDTYLVEAYKRRRRSQRHAGKETR